MFTPCLVGAIEGLNLRLEDLLRAFGVPLAVVDGQRLAALASDALALIDDNALLSCFVNADEVARCMRLPDQQLAEREEEARVEIAANTVQKRARAFLGRRRAAWQRCEAEAAARIVRGWRSRQNLRDLRARLARDRAERDATWRASQADFGVRWGEKRWEPRIIVHVPSLSYSEARAGDSLDLAMCRDEPFVTRHRN